ncbi:MAG: hypothetical protein HZB98_11505 [Bacteroidia bacterium]|nr:hypothetical protein [Bacteroidia bacterium]
MKINSRLSIYLILIFSVSLFASCSRGKIVLENSFFRYEIEKNGNNISYTDKASGIDYLNHERKSQCASIVKNKREYPVTSVNRKGNRLILSFDGTDVSALIQIRKQKDRIILTVSEVNGEVESLTFLNIPLTLEGMPYEPFAACALSMNLFTRVRELPALGDP